jgi:hypothetical protein
MPGQLDDQSPLGLRLTIGQGYRLLIALKRWEETLDAVATRSPTNRPELLESMQELQAALAERLRVAATEAKAAEATRCLYCGEPFERRTAAQKFCCTNHRTYFSKGRRRTWS